MAFPTHDSEGNSLSLPYTRLPDGSEHPDHPKRRRGLKFLVLLLAGFLAAVGLLVSGFGSGSVNNHRDDFELTTNSNAAPSPGPTAVPPRGASEGVSAKSNKQLLGAPPFQWTSDMLAWQRTAFHFQPSKNWMNDPNGPLFYKGWYHLFYQYNPDGPVWGNIVWGHAISMDMIQWSHLPNAMVADHWYDVNGVWTGSATILPDGQVIMLYTGSTNESVQVQNLAYPADLSDPLLVKWVKYSGNPVLVPPPGIHFKDFRDPTTAWFTSEGKWRITIGSKVNKTGISLLYDTVDFINYEMLHGDLHAVPGTGMWECVDFYPVSISEENGLDTSENGHGVKHVMKTSLDDDRNDYYALGTYHEKDGKWIPDDPKIDVGIGLRYDYGIFYASKTFYDQETKRRILWGWIKETDSERSDIKKGWASVQAIPRTILFDKKTGRNIIQWPVEEIKNLRRHRREFEKVEVKPGSVVPLEVGSSSTQLDITAEFEIDQEALMKLNGEDRAYSCSASGGAAERGALGPFGILVLADKNFIEQTPVYFYIVKDTDGNLNTFFCADQSRSSAANDVDKAIYGSTVSVLKGEKLSMRILVDHSIIESFAQGGRTCIASRVYPTKAIYEEARMFLFNNATDAKITASLDVWQMTSSAAASSTMFLNRWLPPMLFFFAFLSWNV